MNRWRTMARAIALAPLLALPAASGVAAAEEEMAAPSAAPESAASRPVESAPATRAAGKGEDEVEVADVEEVKPGGPPWEEETAVIDRIVNLMKARTIRKRSLLLVFDHRTFQPFTEHPGIDFFGFDSGALKIGIGVRYGILERLDAGAYRLNSGTEVFDTYEFDARYWLLDQKRHYLNLAARAGLTWFVQEGMKDAIGFFGQLFIDRTFFKRLTVGTGLLIHSESTSDNKSSWAPEFSLAIPAYVEVRILRWLAWNAEMTAAVAGFGEKWPAFSSAVKFISPRHTFSLVLTNTQYIAADGIVTGAWRGGKDLIVGFNITREIGF